MYDSSLLLVTTAIDQRYRLSVFPSELKDKVETLLQMKFKKHSRREARQRDDSPTYQPPNSSKPQSSTSFDQSSVLSFYSLLTEEKATLQENEQHDELVAEVKGFLGTQNLNTQAKEA